MLLSDLPTTVVAFSRWPVQGQEAAWLSSRLAHALPNLQQWLRQASVVSWPTWPSARSTALSLTPPHEQVLAQLGQWPVVDGGVPTAAQAAVAAGLAQAHSAQGWAWMTLCHWQVSNGQVTLGDPSQLGITPDEDQSLRAAMSPFFAEDGLALHPYRPGQWLIQAPWLDALTTASLERVIGRDVNAWLVGGERAQLSVAAQTLRRLQNEMQMLLYNHPVNAQRAVSVNSFWVHGTGHWQAPLITPPQVRLVNTLREPALQQSGQDWVEAWRKVDAQVLPEMLQSLTQGEPQRLVLCGERSLRVYESQRAAWWQRWRARLQPLSIMDALTELPESD